MSKYQFCIATERMGEVYPSNAHGVITIGREDSDDIESDVLDLFYDRSIGSDECNYIFDETNFAEVIRILQQHPELISYSRDLQSQMSDTTGGWDGIVYGFRYNLPENVNL